MNLVKYCAAYTDLFSDINMYVYYNKYNHEIDVQSH